jgi:hypothetical protein
MNSIKIYTINLKKIFKEISKLSLNIFLLLKNNIMNNVELFEFISDVYNSKLDIIKSNTKNNEIQQLHTIINELRQKRNEDLYKVINNPDIQIKNNDNSIWNKIDKYNEYEGILSAVLDLLKTI